MSAIGSSIHIPLAPPTGPRPGDPGSPTGPGNDGGVSGGGPSIAEKKRDSHMDKLRDRVENANRGANTERNRCNFDGDPNTKWVPAHIEHRNGWATFAPGECVVKK